MSFPFALTITQLMQRTRRLCRDTSSGERFNDDDFIIEKLNDAMKDYVIETDILKAHATIHLLEDVFLYDMPDDIIRLKRVWFSDFAGFALFPMPHAAWDFAGGKYDTSADPLRYFRDLLPPNKIWVHPAPYQDGSTFTRDSLFGLLRAIRDADTGEYMPWDANQALRDIDGVHFEVIGGGGLIIRELIPTTGNLRVDYVRVPEYVTDPAQYPDSDFPQHVHEDFPYGAAWLVLDEMGETADDFALRDDRKGEFFRRMRKTGAELLKEQMTYGFVPR